MKRFIICVKEMVCCLSLWRKTPKKFVVEFNGENAFVQTYENPFLPRVFEISSYIFVWRVFQSRGQEIRSHNKHSAKLQSNAAQLSSEQHLHVPQLPPHHNNVTSVTPANQQRLKNEWIQSRCKKLSLFSSKKRKKKNQNSFHWCQLSIKIL